MRRIRATKIFKTIHLPFLGAGYDSIFQENNRWPDNKLSCVLLTHDVESKEGLSKIEPIRQLERSYGFSSTWNFVLDKYGPVDKFVKSLQEDNCECGAHGLLHDGKLFENKKIFTGRMQEINTISKVLGLKGFRSPSLLRNRSMLDQIDFDWDSSIPAWDPFQPQPGGCECYLPFMLGNNTLELPVTLWQDFTIFYELGQDSIDIWRQQLTSLYNHGGLINIIVHPDYVDKSMLNAYGHVLQIISKMPGVHCCTPSDLVHWNRLRGLWA